MFITKKRHESEIENRDDEISRLRGARMMDAETIRFQSAEIDRLQRNATIDRNAIEDQQKDINAKRAEIGRLRPMAEKYEAKLARDRKRVRGGAKVSVKPAAKKGAR